MFNLRDFIKKGLFDAVGKLTDYQIILNAAGWHEKGVLLEEDLIKIQEILDAKNIDLATEVDDIEPILTEVAE
jgi:hypothetical protein